MATSEGGLAEFVRVRIVPNLLPPIFKLEAACEFAFRTVSQLSLNYRSGPLSEGEAGSVHGGDRLPGSQGDGGSNYHSLRDPTWQVHVYGAHRGELAESHLPVHFFAWTPKHGAAGDLLYLVRPLLCRARRRIGRR